MYVIKNNISIPIKESKLDAKNIHNLKDGYDDALLKILKDFKPMLDSLKNK